MLGTGPMQISLSLILTCRGEGQNLRWGSFESPNKTYKEVEMVHTLEMALKTWSNWGEEWGKNKGENCYNETVPILKEGYHGSESDPRIMQKVEAAIDKLKRRGLKVQMLNITQLSEYRKDAHTTIYRRQWGHLTKEELANPKTRADCIHWCIPGVPDVWNELLYAYIFHSYSPSSKQSEMSKIYESSNSEVHTR
ncbi:hypothetical protein TEA_014641 [Camellia sinensis var. sinensis]|uniref:Trichome birefringence-like C-terminal domain-containing protein n=1 Tax=Camellia sinensis var. sinensis TaxID=542762 RepID=A0A4S4D6Z4_CAMSN|nr:hypothetical protein TEA_014641 [Camellia sinensis var. sinensis]